MKDTCVHVGGY